MSDSSSFSDNMTGVATQYATAAGIPGHKDGQVDHVDAENESSGDPIDVQARDEQGPGNAGELTALEQERLSVENRKAVGAPFSPPEANTKVDPATDPVTGELLGSDDSDTGDDTESETEFDPAEHTIADVDAHLEKHPEDRERVLAAEQARGDDARPTLVEKLQS